MNIKRVFYCEKSFSKCENIVQGQMNYFQNPNIGTNVSRNCAKILVREIEFLGLLFELLPPDIARCLVSYYCKCNMTL